MEQYKNFGEFTKVKRIANLITVRKFAEILGCSPGYVSSVENNRRNPYDQERLEIISEVFHLTEEEKAQMFTLAGKSKVVKSRDNVPVDVSAYIRDNDYVTTALRTARDLNVGREEWEMFVQELKKKY